MQNQTTPDIVKGLSDRISDTDTGQNAVCWRSFSLASEESGHTTSNNPEARPLCASTMHIASMKLRAYIRLVVLVDALDSMAGL